MNLVQKKICLLGDFAVGKTSLVRRYIEGRFDDNYLSTIGVKISSKVLERRDYQLNLIIWDLAGGEKFLGHDKNYLRGAAGAILVCDLTRSNTLEYLFNYAEMMRDSNPKSIFVIAANKADLEGEDEIQDSDLDPICKLLSCSYFFTSAKTGENVENCILLLAKQIESRSEIDPQ